jgi:hypothetical protein
VPDPYRAAAVCGPFIGPDENVITLLDEPNKQVTVPDADAQKQATVLNDLCNGPFKDPLRIKCNYADMAKTKVRGYSHLPTGFRPVSNHSKEAQSSTSYKVNDKITITTSLSASVSAELAVKVLKVLKVAAEAKTTVVEEHTFSQDVTLVINPGRTGYICSDQPMLHYVGPFVATAGNTTWNLPNVALDTPDPDPARLQNDEEQLFGFATWDVPNDTAQTLRGDPCRGFKVNNIMGAKKTS